MKTKKRILPLLLIMFLLLSSIPFLSIQVSASDWEEWEECTHCGSKRSEDSLCDSCGGCGIETMNDCFLEHHCPCGNCELDIPICNDCRQCLDCVSGNVMCVDCGECEDCAGVICEYCQRCTGCVGFEEYCTGCDSCAQCMGMGYCYECELCGNCTEMCSKDDCPFCENCSGNVCDNCGICAFCVHDQFCDNCGNCNECSGPICGGCNYCSDCSTICPDCEDCCSQCENLCESCNRCESCLGSTTCPDCHECIDCSGGIQCESCGYCSNCENICEGCELVCSGCFNFCQECNRCDEYCIELCHGCADYCFECKSSCENCGGCEECSSLCEECEEICDSCANFCQDCNSCENCVKLCSECEEVCDNCEDFCDECGDVCPNCAEFCSDCHKCEDCVHLCHDCWEYCFDCKNHCHDCDSCEECVNLCEDCEEICDWCTDFCLGCNKCEDCVEVCEACGEYCHDCANFCPDCNRCENCVNLCDGCGKVCEDCAKSCKSCGVCENCVSLCAECGHYCENCEPPFCQGCNAGSCCGTVCPTCEEFCGTCQTDWTYKSLDETQHQRQCSCGGFVRNPESHRFKYVVKKYPTSTIDGIGELKCSDCDYVKETVAIPATNGDTHIHDFSLWVTDPNWHYKYCACGAEDSSSQGPHEFKTVIDIEPTTEDYGLKHEECTICGYKSPGEKINPIGHVHNYGTNWKSNAYHHWRECDCGDMVDKDSHSMGEWVVTLEPTETQPGSRERTCTVCAYKNVIAIKPLGEIAIYKVIIDGNAIETEDYRITGVDNLEAVAEGTNLRIRALKNITVNGEKVVASGIKVITINEDKTITINRCVEDPPVTKYTVTFKDYDGAVLKTEKLEEGEDATAPENPTRDGYTFTGWDKGYTNVTSDLIVTATYTKDGVPVNKYTVTFKDYDGTVLKTEKVEEGKDGIAPENPTRDGYTFTGWDKGYTNVTSDLTITATYSKEGVPVNKYTVTFKDHDGTILKTEEVEYGKAAIAPENPTRDGYTFTGWDVAFDNVTGNLTVIAQYVEDGVTTYAVTIAGDAAETTDYTIAGATDLTALEGEVTLTITAVTDITVNGSKVSKGSTKEIVVNKATTITINKYTASSGGGGSSSSSSSTTTTYTIKTSSGKGGIIDADKTVSVRSGRNVEFEIKADEGYEIEDVKVDGKSVGAVSLYEFKRVRADHTISATFKKTEVIEPEEDKKDDFIDVPANEWYYDPIMKATDKGWFSGTSDTTFSPNLSMSRGMIVTVLWRMENQPVSNTNSFTDVMTNNYYTTAVNWASEKGLVTGYGDKLFGPNDSITREQMASILYRYAQYKGYETTVGGMELGEFLDFEEISEYALPPLAWGVNKGLMQGVNNKLMPKDSATRAQVATILVRFSETIVK